MENNQWSILIPSAHLEYIKELKHLSTKNFLVKLIFNEEKFINFNIIKTEEQNIHDIIIYLNSLLNTPITFNFLMKLYCQSYLCINKIDLIFGRTPFSIRMNFPIQRSSILIYEQWKHWVSLNGRNIYLKNTKHVWKIRKMMYEKWELIEDEFDFSFLPSK